MKLRGKDKNGNVREINIIPEEIWGERKIPAQYYIDGKEVTKKKTEELLKEIAIYDINFIKKEK